MCLLQCRWGWRPTAAWSHHCVLVSSGREPGCRHSAAFCRRTTRGYGWPLSPLQSTHPLHRLWGVKSQTCYWSIDYYCLFSCSIQSLVFCCFTLPKQRITIITVAFPFLLRKKSYFFSNSNNFSPDLAICLLCTPLWSTKWKHEDMLYSTLSKVSYKSPAPNAWPVHEGAQ